MPHDTQLELTPLLTHKTVITKAQSKIDVIESPKRFFSPNRKRHGSLYETSNNAVMDPEPKEEYSI